MKKNKVIYICETCGYESIRWLGCCPSCKEWNRFNEKEIEPKKSTATKQRGKLNINVKRLNEITSSNSDRIVTNLNEFNRVMGGGIVKDSITIITAAPGAGKSTLLLQVADDMAQKGYKVLYTSGEESESQIKNRADRILDKVNENIWVFSDTSMDNVLATVENIDPDLIIVDSIQTFTLEEYTSRPGSPIQTMECASELLKIAKDTNRPRAVIMVAQMTKNDEMAGLRALEHLVDTVLIITGESGEELKSLITSKNRFGSTGEMGFFSMTDKGLNSIDNPSEYFITRRDHKELVSGSALTVTKEGTRPIIVEVESLVSTTFTAYPSRIGECLRRDQLNTLISLLEQRAGIKLFDKNVVVKTTGGLKITEQSVNLAIIMSITSSVYNKGIASDTAFIADVGLTGELKKVPSLESRIRELDRMGFSKVYIAKDAVKGNFNTQGIEVIDKKNLKEVIGQVFK
ncbi:DNA repair protein RadA/Sms [Desulfonispora thiosulfatigenes DSM 11270]|uniref:DNA repair protein RadA n=1 Tax=Desulfonispora thiosulfatigenes DSM 11270 TaxID=656914 RepID=A0A1W1UUK7_DESTI|nr:DNA repair protein RadA [Desulfonispora thiosulfatigenes]SMB84501.1 DNA repair protein RadA/Sms [Desulfonispora thiosulfatigenes DSM 11270]